MPAPDSEPGRSSDRQEWFATTHWSVVLTAGDANSPRAAEALEKLCRTYWYPLYAYVRRRGHSPEDAQDLTQDFFAALLEKNYLARADKERGRFRTFLLTNINNFLHNEHDRATRLKRGGGRDFVSWEEHVAEGRYAKEPASGLTPEQIFEKRWATTLLERVLARLREEAVRDQRREFYDQLKPHLWGESDAAPYAELAARFDMTVTAIKVTVHRLRRCYRDLLRDEIAQTVADPSEVEGEIQYLLRVMSE